MNYCIVVHTGYDAKMRTFCGKSSIGFNFFLWRIVTFPKLVLRSKPKIYLFSILFIARISCVCFVQLLTSNLNSR